MAYTSSMMTYHDEAYCRVENMEVGKQQNTSKTQLAIFANEAAAAAGAQPIGYSFIENQSFDYSSANNFVSQSYAIIKTSNRFSSSIDC